MRLWKLVPALFCMLAGGQTFAQTFTEVTGTPVAALQAVGWSSTAWGDYDNDGDLDLLAMGTNNTSQISAVYRNDNGTFTNINASLIGLMYGSTAWGDYDNDNDLDILLTGTDGTNDYSKIYRNDGAGTFTDINASLPGMRYGTGVWGDYDNDGDLDILLSGGQATNIYRNNGGGSFTSINAGLPGLGYTAAAWGDYDNDNDLDLVLTGIFMNRISAIYRNDNGVFTDINAGLASVFEGSVAWGDYDNDGDLDLLLTGRGENDYNAKIYRNDGGGTFVDIGANIPGVQRGSATWGDYDNDGDLDFLFTGYTGNNFVGTVYRNDGGGSFTDINAGFRGVYAGGTTWADYDKDNDLDIVLTGLEGSTPQIRLYRNNSAVANTPPSTPTGLMANVSGSTVTLTWNASTDAQTPSSALTYNVRVGISNNGTQRVSQQASLITGFRRVVDMGNGQLGTSFKLNCLPNVTYFWSVQAVDNTFAGSGFAAQSTFAVNAPLPTITAFSPADASAGMNVTDNLVLTFSENMQRGSGNIVIKRVGSNTVVETFPTATSSRLSFNNNVVTIDPTNDLAANTQYFVEISFNALHNTCGFATAPSDAWDFSTAAPGVLTSSVMSLSGFRALEGSPSAAQTYTLSGSALTNNVNIAASSSYEISLDGNTWSSNLSIGQTSGVMNGSPATIHVRLKAGVTPGTANGTVTHTSAGTPTRTVTLSGTVVSLATVYVRKDGSDANEGTANTAAGAKLTMQAAMNLVNDGGTVMVNPGTYDETLTVTKNATLQTAGTVKLQHLVMNGSGKTLTLSGAIGVSEKVSLTAGTVAVASNGNLTLLSTPSQTALIDDFSMGNTGTITGNINAQRFVFSAVGGYRYLSSPVTGATVAQLGTMEYPSYYNEPQVLAEATSISAGWVALGTNDIIMPIRGVSAYYASGMQTLALTGTPNTGNFSTTVTRTNSGNFTGYNVLGNPYPSPVSWSAIWNLNNNSVIHKTVYVWNNAQNKSALYNFETNQAANGGSNEIAQGQAFRIRVNMVGISTPFSLNNSVRLATSSNNFLRTEPKKVSEKLRLVLSSGKDKEGYETLIHSLDDATTGMDVAYDGEFIADKGVDVIYSKSEGEKMTINALPELKGERTVALGVEVQAAGQYTISAKEIENFAPATAIYLEDRKLGKLVDLTTEPSYSVYLDAPEANRFFVHFNASARTEGAAVSFVNIYSSANEVNVQFSDAAASKGSIAVVNMLGQTVAEVATEKGQQVANLELDAPEGVYIVRVSSEGGTVSRKVLISRK